MNKHPLKHSIQNTYKTALLLFFCLYVFKAKGQDQDIGTESVTVVKTYAPIVRIGAKPIIAPLLSSFKAPKPLALSYPIASFPVASTFSPFLGDATPLPTQKPPKAYQSLLHLGLGMRQSAEVLFDTQIKKSRYEQFTLGLEHRSMGSDLPEVNWDSNFYNTTLNGGYVYNKKQDVFKATLGLRHLAYSWYGVPIANNTDLLSVAPNFNLQQGYFGTNLTAQYKKQKGVFKNADITLRDFREALGGNEQRIGVTSLFQFPLGDVPLSLAIGYNRIEGRFKQAPLSTFNQEDIASYTFDKWAAAPSITLNKGNGLLKIGAQLVYANTQNTQTTGLKIYPDLYGHYPLLAQQLIAFGSLTGDFKLNSFEGFVNENPFVSPTLTLLPTDIRHHLRLGVKGLLGSLSYELFWAQNSSNNRPLFVENPQNLFNTYERQFNYGNSFELIYDAITENSLGVSMQWEPFSGVLFKGQFTKNAYELTLEQDAWHLPEETATLELEYTLSKNFSLGVMWDYVGLRAARSSQMVQTTTSQEPMLVTTYALNAYSRLGLKMSYKVNERLGLFLKGNNLTDTTYDLWSGFVAPPRIILLGGQYRFNL